MRACALKVEVRRRRLAMLTSLDTLHAPIYPQQTIGTRWAGIRLYSILSSDSQIFCFS